MIASPSPTILDALERPKLLDARRERAWRTLIPSILASTALYALMFGLLVYESRWGANEIPRVEEIPVEIVVEPPAPPEPTPTPTPPPAAPKPEIQTPMDLKPAYDAPREGNNDKRDDEHAADPEKPSAAPPPPAPPTPSPAPAPPAPVEPAPPSPDAEAPAPAKAEPAPPAPPSPPTPQPEKPAPAPANKPYVFEALPDLDFGGAAIKAPVSGGKSKAGYLNILFGLITPRMRVPPVAHTYGRRLSGKIAFSVDGRGKLLERWVAESSGSPELDAAAMQAIASASASFPPPPGGGPVGMSYTYSTK